MATLGPRSYKLTWDAHSTTGVVIGLALFVLFVTGALVLFRGEIRQWEEPALRSSSGERASLDALAGPVLDSLSRGEGPSYVYADVSGLPHGSLYLHLSGGVEGGSRNVWVNPTTGAWISPPDEGTATQTLYYLHFFYQLGAWGLYLAGLVGLFALFAIVTGTLVHLDRLVDDFFQFRPRESLRVAWADAHKVLGTIGLPFQTMYVFTGAYFGLVGLIALPYATFLFDGGMGEFYQKAGYYAPRVQVDSAKATPSGSPTLERLAARAEATGPNFEVTTLVLRSVGQPNGRVEVMGRQRGTVFGGTGSVVFHGQTGERLHQQPPRQAGPLNETVQSMEVLHFAEFGGLLLDVLFFLLALASAAVVLTGTFTWLEVRRSRDRAIDRVLARLTAGVATGLAPALALLFLSAHVLPESLAHPGRWTNVVFFGSWGLGVCYALGRTNVARTHRTLLAVGGLLALLIPVANGFATGDWPWRAWAARHWATLGVDVGAALWGGAALGLAACLEVEASSPDDESPSSSQNPRRRMLSSKEESLEPV